MWVGHLLEGNMITLKNVTKKFGSTVAVDNVSFEVNKGEIVGFLGPNGAGKTTTMRIITGYFPPTEGEVSVAGFDMAKNPIPAKEKIGYMPENVPLYKEMEVYPYLKFIAEIKGIPKDKIEPGVAKAMEEAAITGVKNKIIGKLSKGYRQRVGIAQAILNDPDVLVLDEPTVGLDPKQIREIRELIKNMKGERTIILSTHILPEVSMTCDKVIVINDGTIIAQDEVKNLTGKTQKSSKVSLTVDAPKTQFMSEMKKIKGVAEVAEEAKLDTSVYSYIIGTEEGKSVNRDIISKIVKNNWELIELKKQQFTLEDVFLKLVTREDN